MKLFTSLLVLLTLLPSCFAGILCTQLLKVILNNDRLDGIVPFDFSCRCSLRLILFFRPVKFECSTQLCSDEILGSEIVKNTLPIDVPLVEDFCIKPTLSGTMRKFRGGDMTLGGCTSRTAATVNVTTIVENVAAEFLSEILDQYLDELLEKFISDYLNGAYVSQGSQRLLLGSERRIEELLPCEIETLEDIIRCNITTLDQLFNQTDIVTLLNDTNLDTILNNDELVDKFVTILNGTDINDLLNGTAITDLLNYDISNYNISDFIDISEVNIFDYFNISDLIPGLEEVMTYNIPDTCLTVDTKRSLILNGDFQIFKCKISIGGRNCGCEVCGENRNGILFPQACLDRVLEIFPPGLRDFIPKNFSNYCLDASGLARGRGAAEVMLAPFTSFGFQV